MRINGTYAPLLALASTACLLLGGVPQVARADVAGRTPPAATAPQVNLPAGRETANAAEELTQLQEDTVLLKAQLKRLDAQAQVAERTAALNRLGGAPNGLDEIRVVAIEGLGRKLLATLQLPDGGQFDVHPGDTLPNGMHIAAIENRSVTIERKGEKPTQLLLTAFQGDIPHTASVSNQPYPGPALPSLSFPKD